MGTVPFAGAEIWQEFLRMTDCNEVHRDREPALAANSIEHDLEATLEQFVAIAEALQE